jgi:Ca2+/Na+ antiporter
MALLIAGACVGLVAAVASVVVHDGELQRRIYWLGWLIAALCFALAVLPRGWPGSVAIGLLALFAAVVYAYLRTPFLKIGGRVYAVSSIQEEAASDPPQHPRSAASDDSYPAAMGSLPARNMWWILVAMTGIVSLGIYLVGWTWQMILGAVFLTLMGALAGIDDGSRKLPIARGQHVQAFIVSVGSILLWLAPPICYYIGYRVGQRWPMGRGRHARHLPDA